MMSSLISLPPTAVLCTTLVNATQGYRFDESELPVGEIFCARTEGDLVLIPRKELFDDLVGDYGRCTGRVYVDSEERAIPVGWVFESRQKHQDDPSQTYLREVWVSFVVKETTITHIEI